MRAAVRSAQREASIFHQRVPPQPAVSSTAVRAVPTKILTNWRSSMKQWQDLHKRAAQYYDSENRKPPKEGLSAPERPKFEPDGITREVIELVEARFSDHFGSLERFLGILIENHAGRMPFWMAPRQIVVATITSDADDYAHEVVEALTKAGLRAEADLRNEKISFGFGRSSKLTSAPSASSSSMISLQRSMHSSQM